MGAELRSLWSLVGGSLEIIRGHFAVTLRVHLAGRARGIRVLGRLAKMPLESRQNFPLNPSSSASEKISPLGAEWAGSPRSPRSARPFSPPVIVRVCRYGEQQKVCNERAVHTPIARIAHNTPSFGGKGLPSPPVSRPAYTTARILASIFCVTNKNPFDLGCNSLCH